MSSERTGVGIIGTGRRGFELGTCIIDLYGTTQLEIRALCNRTRVRMEEAKASFLSRYRNRHGVSPSMTLYEKYDDLIGDPDVDLVLVVTPTYAHEEPAVKAVRAGKKVFLDKPIAQNLEGALKIRKAEQESNNPLVMGFTRRFEQKWLDTFEIIQGGAVGDVKMLLHRAVVPYHNIFQTYMRRLEWSGGALAEKVSHLFDVLNWFAGEPPDKVSSFGGRLVYVPQENAPKRCRECDRVCPYRVGEKQEMVRQDNMVDFGDSRALETELIKLHDICVWLPGADINDHGIVNVAYPGGIKATIFWSLFGPDSDDQETLEIVGEKGKILLTRHPGRIDVISGYGERHEVFDKKPDRFENSHFGADHRLIEELDRFCKTGVSPVSAKEGLGSARLVEASHRSVDAGGELVYMRNVAGAELL
ncbi:MAG TPA: Gfo/Idh/MocA family oxidoreductase [Spirochaetes bacterium]|nr:Gfo/Idh/MocA family oxidoreductase [Spirochaetota bacterium]